MTTINYVGAAIANYKSVKLTPGVNALDPNAVVQIGLGPYLLTLEGGWNATDLANLWNSSANPYFKTITATVSGTSVILTAINIGQDFEPVCTINGTSVQVSSLMTFSIVASAGSFTLSDGTLTTGAITYSATPATLITRMLTAINALAGYTSGDVSITYDAGTSLFTFDFSNGQFAGVNIPTWTANAASLTGGTAAATITRTQTGNAGTDEIISISFPADGTHIEDLNTIQKIVVAGTSGSFTLDVPGIGTTESIPFNAGRSVAKRILEDLIGQGNSIVTGGPLSTESGTGTGSASGSLINRAYFTNSGSLGSGPLTTTSPTKVGSLSNAEPQTDALLRYTLPVAQGAVVTSAILTLTRHLSGGSGANCFGNLYTLKHDDASMPADGAAAVADWLANASSVAASFFIPAIGFGGTLYPFDITVQVQEVINRGGWVSGNHLIVYFQASGTSGEQAFTTATLDVVIAGSATYTHRDMFVEFTGDLAGTDIAAMTPAGAASATVTVTQAGGSQTVENISGGVWSLVIPNHFTVPNIPFDVTNTALQTLIDAAAGGACSAVTGGPAPSTPLVIHFNGLLATTAMNPYLTLALLGSFSQSVRFTEVRAAQPTPAAQNVYEMVVCPGEGTLALTDAAADVTRFFAVLTILEPNPINPIYDPTLSRQIFIPLLNINGDRIEGAINEAFGKDVVRVTRTGHSLEHRRLAMHENVSAVSSEAGFLHFWYYIDRFRLVFVNDYALQPSISQITISFASISDVNPTPAGPSIWMDTHVIPATQSNTDGDFKDMYPEFVRTYLGFTGMEAAGTPIHILSIAPYNSYTDNKLSYKGKLMSQYPFVGSVLATPLLPLGQTPLRAGLAKQIVDHTIIFHWIKYIYDRDNEVPGNGTEAAGTSVSVPWNAQPEVFQSALEVIFGTGNVTVTGSLVNSWLSEDDIDIPDEEEAYNELRITLINQVAYLPFNEIGYGLSMTLINPFDQDNDTVRCAVPYLEPYSKPLPLQINNRQRIVMDASSIDTFSFGVGTSLIPITRATTCQQAQEALNALLGLCICPGPVKYQQPVTLYGSNFSHPVEIEFTGAGYQFTQEELVFGFTGADSIGLLTVTQIGVNPTQEVQALVISGNPHGGTYTVHGSGSLAYNAIAATIQTAVGAPPPTVSGTYPNFFFTWPSASGSQTLWTTTSALNNSGITIVQIQQGGTVNGVSASVSVIDLAQGQGPLYWDNNANYSPAQVPGSNDLLVFDDATSAVNFGIDQSSIFTVTQLGASARLRHTRLRQVFQNNQKVWLKTQGTAPTGLTLGDYYYVVNQLPDYTFQLSATPGGSPIAITTVGVGPLMLAVHNLEVQIYARYAGSQIALPNINSGIGLPEYLPRYLVLSGPTMTIGIGEGNALSMLRVNTMTEQATIEVQQSGQSQITSIPAFLFLFNNVLSSINIIDGDCGIAVYSDETSTIGPISGTGGSLLIHAINATSINANGLVVTEQKVHITGMSSL